MKAAERALIVVVMASAGARSGIEYHTAVRLFGA
jgi:hypothetical protein